MLHNQSALRLERLARRDRAEPLGLVKEIALSGGLRPRLAGAAAHLYR